MVLEETEPPFNQAEGCGVIPGGREMLQCLEFMTGSKLRVSAEPPRAVSLRKHTKCLQPSLGTGAFSWRTSVMDVCHGCPHGLTSPPATPNVPLHWEVDCHHR